MTTFDNLQRRFQSSGINTSTPGFYDAPGFRTAERADPSLLDEYAAFVRNRPVDAPYIQHARQAINDLATYISPLLERDGRQRMCAPTAMLLVRMLDGKGIWNYAVRGL
jgi:hypothetical protein